MRVTAVACIVLVSPLACNQGAGSASVVVQMRTVGSQSQKPSVGSQSAALTSAPLDAPLTPTSGDPGATVASFTPVGLKFPIRSVGVQGSKVIGNVYECPSTTTDGCLVDLAYAVAVENLMREQKSIMVEADGDNGPRGSISALTVETCAGNTDAWTFYVKGTMTIGGATYYTQADGANPLTTNAGSYDFAPIRTNGCVTKWLLPSPVAVSDGATIRLSLFVNLDDVAYGLLRPAPQPGGCTGSTTSSLCASLVAPQVYIGDGSPSLEGYLVTDKSTGFKGKLHLLIGADDEPIGGFARTYYDGSVLGIYNFDGGGVATVVKKDGGKYAVKQYGDTGAEIFEAFSAFERADHSGTMIVKNSGPAAYTATKLPR